jgi:hypothetical protein
MTPAGADITAIRELGGEMLDAITASNLKARPRPDTRTEARHGPKPLNEQAKAATIRRKADEADGRPP